MTGGRPERDRTVAVVTGGRGFIGTHLVRGLTSRGVRVVTIDTAPPHPAAAGDVQHVHQDVTDLDGCVEAMRTADPHLVFHLAATSTIDSAHRDPHRSLAVNVTGTINVLEAARSVAPRLQRFVLTSTDKVYGELDGEAYRETTPLAARGVYDVGKLAADTVAGLYAADLGLPATTLRLCNVFGPGDHNTGSRIVPRSLARLFDPGGPLPPLVYEGSMGHGRDYVYVDDVVGALEAVAGSAAACGEAFNMAPAAHRTTLDLVEELIERAADRCAVHDPRRARTMRKNGYEIVPGGGAARALQRQHCDGTKLSALVGFRPSISFAEGLDRTVGAHLRSCPPP